MTTGAVRLVKHDNTACTLELSLCHLGFLSGIEVIVDLIGEIGHGLAGAADCLLEDSVVLRVGKKGESLGDK